MATNSLQSLHHPLLKHHLLDTPPPSLSSSFHLNPKPITNNTLSLSHSTTTFSLSSTSTSAPTSQATTFDLLHQHLSSRNFREADEETRRLLIALAGEAAVKRGYVFFSEVQFISEADLKAIDDLWREHSNNKFGYSVQKRIFDKEKRDFTRFFIKIGWMKLLETEVVQYNYRAFPSEFIWELNDDTPEGHLPLTNALRGTQLLNSVLNHPAFEGTEEAEDEEGDGLSKGLRDGSKPLLSKNLFKTDYSF